MAILLDNFEFSTTDSYQIKRLGADGYKANPVRSRCTDGVEYSRPIKISVILTPENIPLVLTPAIMLPYKYQHKIEYGLPNGYVSERDVMNQSSGEYTRSEISDIGLLWFYSNELITLHHEPKIQTFLEIID